MKFPIGIQDFKKIREGGFVYVDKTELLYQMVTGKGVYIFEFKLDGSAEEALRQIEAKGYARPYAADHRPVRRIGVSFSSVTGTIEDWKDEIS